VNDYICLCILCRLQQLGYGGRGKHCLKITAMEENHVNEADVLQPAITERVAITEMETVVETENNFVGDEQQHINSHTTTEPCPAAVTEDGDE